uniref:Uncharacterized protein n=1 Tax=Arundo donax TaxID=35708 RepID=A0A0A9C962_ARUDO
MLLPFAMLLIQNSNGTHAVAAITTKWLASHRSGTAP